MIGNPLDRRLFNMMYGGKITARKCGLLDLVIISMDMNEVMSGWNHLDSKVVLIKVLRILKLVIQFWIFDDYYGLLVFTYDYETNGLREWWLDDLWCSKMGKSRDSLWKVIF